MSGSNDSYEIRSLDSLKEIGSDFGGASSSQSNKQKEHSAKDVNIQENKSFSARREFDPSSEDDWAIKKIDDNIFADCGDSGRKGDSGFGHPHDRSDEKFVKNVEVKPYPQEEPEADFDFSKEESFASGFSLPNVLRKYLRLILFFVAAVIAFFLVTQTAAFLANLRKVSFVEQIVLALPLILFGGVIVYVVYKLIRLVLKLKISPQVQFKALQELEERYKLRTLSLKANRDAVDRLTVYLKNEFSVNEKLLKSFGVKSDDIAQLEKSRKNLISPEKIASTTSVDWLRDFKCEIQDVLDEIAKKRIMKYSVNVAVMTGASPFALIDRLVMLSSSLSMLKELLEIYSLKPGWDKSLALMAQFIVNTYCAGIIDGIAENATEQIEKFAEKMLDKQIPDLSKKIVGKLAEGLVQGGMIYRLGNSAIKVLHPIKLK